MKRDNARKIIRQLDADLKRVIKIKSLKRSYRVDKLFCVVRVFTKLKRTSICKWQICPSKINPGNWTPEWVTSRQNFLVFLRRWKKHYFDWGSWTPEFDLYTYIWIYTYPELAVQKPVIFSTFFNSGTILILTKKYPSTNLINNQDVQIPGK